MVDSYGSADARRGPVRAVLLRALSGATRAFEPDRRGGLESFLEFSWKNEARPTRSTLCTRSASHRRHPLTPSIVATVSIVRVYDRVRCRWYTSVLGITEEILLNLERIRRAFAHHCPEATSLSHSGPRAAVAMILAGEEDDLHLCVIRRAKRAGDPWSGHMALPGGRAAPHDVSAQATAERETREEVGIALAAAEQFGALSELRVNIKSVVRDMVLSSFVYYLGHHPPKMNPNHEVAAAHWVSLSHLWNIGNVINYEFQNARRLMTHPGIRFSGHVIWDTDRSTDSRCFGAVVVGAAALNSMDNRNLPEG